MRSAHTVERVREAERALMARLPEGALMQRAAAGLAYAVLELLGRAYGARALLLVGSGDNGGDALYAGVLLARRGVAVEALLLSPEKVHRAGLAALRGAGGRVVGSAAGAGTPDVVVDGIVGIGGRPPLREEAAAALAAFEGVPVV
ncbi:MAG TPA: NAD(P)H-hydrate epimerase, partial [Nocardioidaceae bacterium]|nr:NAD(P)H-hydrate epimerase [Nocardioidaceae bacterium]